MAEEGKGKGEGKGAGKGKGEGKGEGERKEKAMFRNKSIILMDCAGDVVYVLWNCSFQSFRTWVSVRVMQEPHVLEIGHNENICFASKDSYSSFADA